MLRNWNRMLTLGLLISMLLAVGSSVSIAAQFSAEMKENIGDSTATYQFYCQNLKYRFAGVEYGDEFILIVNQETSKTIVLHPQPEQYMLMDVSDLLSMIADPFQVIKMWVDFGEITEAGTEEISGYSCKKTDIAYGGEAVLVYWQSDELGMPLKIEMYGQGARSMQLINIKEEAVDDSLFEIPEGYTEFISPEDLPPEIPEWAVGIPDAPLMTPPFEHQLAAGEMLRIATVVGKSIRLRRVGETEGTVRAIPFKDGRPLKEPTWYNNFARSSSICERRQESFVEADEVVVRVFDGVPLTIEAKFGEMHEHAVKAGRKFGISLIDENITVRVVNLSDGESVFSWKYFRGDQRVSEDEIGPDKYRTESLKKKGDLYQMTWTAIGDALEITVSQGEVQIKLGQFESFKF